jgi:hypothetical protein
MLPALIAVVAIAMIVAAWLLWRLSRRATASERIVPTSTVALIESRPVFPPEGLLVSEDVLRAAGSTSGELWGALEAAAVPVALEYYPVSESEIAKYRAVPVNASVQQAMVGIVEALDPRGPTLFRAVLPKGAELVRAVGADGFRGFSRTGGNTVHAVLKPVAVTGAVAAGWPVFAVAGTVFAIDMVAQREQRAFQRRVEASLGRQEGRYYVERIAAQKSADHQLSRAISLMLDGDDPPLELALHSADVEFIRSQQFLEAYSGVIDGLVDDQGKVDYRRLEKALGGDTKETNHFIRELHLTRAGIAIQRKALIADAAARALADSSNPYLALRKFLDGQVHQVEQADAAVHELTEQIMLVELKGRWHDRGRTPAERQEWLRAQISPPAVDGAPEVVYLVTASREMLQLLPASEDEPSPLALDE